MWVKNNKLRNELCAKNQLIHVVLSCWTFKYFVQRKSNTLNTAFSPLKSTTPWRYHSNKENKTSPESQGVRSIHAYMREADTQPHVEVFDDSRPASPLESFFEPEQMHFFNGKIPYTFSKKSIFAEMLTQFHVSETRILEQFNLLISLLCPLRDWTVLMEENVSSATAPAIRTWSKKNKLQNLKIKLTYYFFGNFYSYNCWYRKRQKVYFLIFSYLIQHRFPARFGSWKTQDKNIV